MCYLVSANATHRHSQSPKMYANHFSRPAERKTGISHQGVQNEFFVSPDAKNE